MPRTLRWRSPLGDLPREVGVLAAVAFAVAVGFGIVSPALPVFARDFGVGRAAAGAVISAFAFARILFALPAGKLIDRFGERVLLATGIGIVAVSSALAGLARSYVELVCLRGAGGVGSAMFSVSAMSLLLRSVPAPQRGRASGLFSGGFLFGGIAGPAVGGVVTSWSIRAPFFIYAGTLVVAGTIALTALRGTRLRDRVGRREAPVKLAAMFRLRAYRAALGANLADSWAAVGARSALVPLFVTDVLHTSQTWTGAGFFLMAAGNGAMLLPAGRYADRRGRRPVLIAGCLTSAAAVSLLAVSHHLGLYLGAMVLFGLGSGLLDVAPAAVVGDLTGGGGGSVVAAYQMSGDAGSITGPVVAGALADAASYGVAFGATAGVLGLAALLAVAAPETVAASAGTGAGKPAAEALEPSSVPPVVGETPAAPDGRPLG